MKEQGRVTEAKEKLIKTKNLLGRIFINPLSSFDILSLTHLLLLFQPKVQADWSLRRQMR